MNLRKICIQPLLTEGDQSQKHREPRRREQLELSGRGLKDWKKQSKNKENEDLNISLKGKSGRLNTLQDFNSISTTSSKPQKDLHQQYTLNQSKISKLRNKLSQLYSHYQSQKLHLEQIQQKVSTTCKLKEENESIAQEISRIKNMVKEALLNRQKNRLTVRRG